MTEEELKKAHKHSFKNKDELVKAGSGACFYCCKGFHTKEISKWADINGKTALCPYCGIDAVIAVGVGFDITSEFLGEMHQRFFTVPTHVIKRDENKNIILLGPYDRR